MVQEQEAEEVASCPSNEVWVPTNRIDKEMEAQSKAGFKAQTDVGKKPQKQKKKKVSEALAEAPVAVNEHMMWAPNHEIDFEAARAHWMMHAAQADLHAAMARSWYQAASSCADGSSDWGLRPPPGISSQPNSDLGPLGFGPPGPCPGSHVGQEAASSCAAGSSDWGWRLPPGISSQPHSDLRPPGLGPPGTWHASHGSQEADGCKGLAFQ